MTDLHTDAIFGASVTGGDTVIKFPVSRIVLDPERFIDDTKEPMSARGMGVVYTTCHDGRILRANLDEKDRLIREYYNPHHAALALAVDRHIENLGKCLILDCHSFPSSPLPYELNQNLDRPQICIGTDAFHTPAWLRDILVSEFRTRGYSVAVDEPFAGTIVPSKHFGYAQEVASIMIELRRDLYMDERTGEISPCVEKLTGDLAKAIMALRLEAANRLLKDPSP